MDWDALLQFLWPILLLLWVVLARFLGRRAAPEEQARPLEEEPTFPPEANGDLGELMERLRRALAPAAPMETSPAADEAQGRAPAAMPETAAPFAARHVAAIAPVAPGEPRRRSRSTLRPLRTLRGGGPALRQAIVLREILGPPVALRPQGERGLLGELDSGL
jgi:hypothetical protein